MRDINDIKKDIAEIEKFDECEGLLGFAVMESVSDVDNSYSDVGKGLLQLVESKPEYAGIIEETVIAITGWSFNSLINEMRAKKDYYYSL